MNFTMSSHVSEYSLDGHNEPAPSEICAPSMYDQILEFILRQQI